MKSTGLFFLLSLFGTALCFEPLTGFYAGVAAVSSLVIASYDVVFCRLYECCTDRWVHYNYTGLEFELKKRLYGQHLVKKAVTSHIRGHALSKQPPKALVLAFHGPTGTGKNYVSRIVAEMLFKKGLQSKNVHLIAATKEFPHQQMVPLYKDKLRELIETQVRKCPQSLFIFDEVDKMPAGLIDTIKPYLDYYEQLDGVDYRRSTFIFLSNTGGTAITEYMLQRWRDGAHREDIKLVEVEKILAKAAINSDTQGGLWHSELISKHLVTAFIPFLPLPKKNIRQCIRDTIYAKGYYPDHMDRSKNSDWLEKKIDEVMDELTFYPEQEQLFSVTGCKRVAEKVDFVML